MRDPMGERRIRERLVRLFGPLAGDGCADVGRAPLGSAILALAGRAAELHVELDGVEGDCGDGGWPVEGLLTVMEYAALLGIDLDAEAGGA